MSVKQHTCGDLCKGRSTPVPCLICNGKFFLKCFNVDSSLLSKLSSQDSHVRFVCGACILQRQKPRNSIGATASIAAKTIQDTNPLEQKINDILDKVSKLTPHENLPNSNDKIDFTPILNKLETISQSVFTTSAKLDGMITNNQLKDCTSNVCKSVEAKCNEISKLIRNMNEASSGNFNSSDKTINDLMNSTHRPSTSTQKPIDDSILEIVTNSDKMTWESIDALRDTFKKHKEILNSIKTTIENNNTGIDQILYKCNGNLSTIEDRENKEAMTHSTKNLPETSKKSQKRQSPTRSGRQPEITSVAKTTSNPFRRNKDNHNNHRSTISQTPSMNRSYTQDNTDWTIVTRRRQRPPVPVRQTEHKTHSDSNEKNTLFWSKLSKNFDMQIAQNFIVSNGLAKNNEFKISALTKESNATYISYKIEANKDVCDRIINYTKMPAKSYVRKFHTKKKLPTYADLARRNKNFL